MRDCPYAAQVYVNGIRYLVQCRRRTVLGSAGWHLHDAPVPSPLMAHRNVRIRWRSSSAPDYHEDHPRGPAVRDRSDRA